jgi:hypothetical protein
VTLSPGDGIHNSCPESPIQRIEKPNGIQLITPEVADV